MNNCPRSAKIFLILAIAGMFVCAPAFAQMSREQLAAAGVDPDDYLQQQAATESVPAPQWGASSAMAIRIPVADFLPRLGTPVIYGSNGSGARWPVVSVAGTSDAYFDAPVDLPAGALVTGFRADYCDTNATSNLNVYFQHTDEPSGTNFTSYTLASTGSPGCTSMFLDLTPQNIVINRLTRSYWVRAGFGTVADGTLKIRGAVVFYKLQVSAAPAVASFNDVPTTHPFFRYVEAMVASGLTGGCAPGLYCIDQPVTRGQMAVFLSRALGLHFAN